MAQKKGAVAKKANGVAKTPLKRQAKAKAVEAAPVKTPLKKPTKKQQLQPVKQVEPVEEESSDEEANGIQMDDGSESETEISTNKGVIDAEAEEDSGAEEDSDDGEELEVDQAVGDSSDDDNEEEDDAEVESDDGPEPGEVSIKKQDDDDEDNDENDDDENDDDENDDDDDEAPEEKSIEKKSTEMKSTEKKSKKEGGTPKIPVGKIVNTPNERIIFVTNLPPVYKHTALLEVFSKFGTITMVERIKTKTRGSHVFIAYETPEAANAAIAESKNLTMEGSALTISRRNDKESLDKRTIVVGLIGPNTTKEQLKAHFESCGTIEVVTLSKNRAYPNGFVRFASEQEKIKAHKLNYSLLNDRYITIRDVEFKSPKAPLVTVTVRNETALESYNPVDLEKALKKCGELVDLEVACTRSVLAFATFKTPEAANKAMQLNDQVVGDLKLRLELFELSSSPRTIVVSNLASGVTEDELHTLFSQSGEIDHIKMLHQKAVIKFKTDDGFCKSFLLNEAEVQNRPIFLEPSSILKFKIEKRKMHFKYQQGGNAGGGPPNKFNGGGHPGKFPGGGRPGKFSGSGPGKFPNKFAGGPGSFNKKPHNNKPGGFNKFKRPAPGNDSTPHFYKRARAD